MFAVHFVGASSKGTAFNQFLTDTDILPWKEAYHDFGKLVEDCRNKVFPKGSIIVFENIPPSWQAIRQAGYAIHILERQWVGNPDWEGTPG